MISRKTFRRRGEESEEKKKERVQARYETSYVSVNPSFDNSQTYASSLRSSTRGKLINRLSRSLRAHYLYGRAI